MDNQGRNVTAGNAAKIAADIALESVRSNLDPDSVVQVWSGILPAVTSVLITVSEGVEHPEPSQPAPTPGFQPAQALQTAFQRRAVPGAAGASGPRSGPGRRHRRR
jgi:hypothetical protein